MTFYTEGRERAREAFAAELQMLMMKHQIALDGVMWLGTLPPGETVSVRVRDGALTVIHKKMDLIS